MLQSHHPSSLQGQEQAGTATSNSSQPKGRHRNCLFLSLAGHFQLSTAARVAQPWAQVLPRGRPWNHDMLR